MSSQAAIGQGVRRDRPGPLWGALLSVMRGKGTEPPGARVVRLRTLLAARWLAITGQTAAVFLIEFVFGFSLPLVPCLAVIAVSAVFNLVLQLRYPFTKRLSIPEATFHSGFDICQMALLLGLTGGLQNPFTLLILAPITVSASLMGLRPTIVLGGLGFFFITVLAFWHEPLPWRDNAPLEIEPVYLAGIWTAMTFGIVFNSAYAWWVSRESWRMQTALAATQQVLSREQRLAALGGLAAAAAHELGTPLATIALVAKEMSRDMGKDDPHFEDVSLLRDQAERCREILSRLSRQPGEGDAVVSELPLKAMLDSIAAPHRDLGVAVDVTVENAQGKDAAEPRVTRLPEIDYGLGNLIENAVDFASARVAVRGRWTGDELIVRIADDGPGFSPDVFDRLGEPYVSTRAPSPDFAADAGDGHDAEGQHGMGLGFFIAKTLLTRTGADLAVANRTGGREPGERGGAEVTVRWPIERIRAKE